MKRKSNYKIRFPKTKVVGKKRLGQRRTFSFNSKKNFFKKNFYKKGKKGGLQYHHKKMNVVF